MLYADDRGMFSTQNQKRVRLGKHLVHPAFQFRVIQALDDHLTLHVAIVTEEGGAEAADAEDAPRLILPQRKGGVVYLVEGHGFGEYRQPFVPLTLLQSGEVRLVVVSGPFRSVVRRFRRSAVALLRLLKETGGTQDVSEKTQIGGTLALERQIAELVQKPPRQVLLARAVDSDGILWPGRPGLDVVVIGQLGDLLGETVYLGVDADNHDFDLGGAVHRRTIVGPLA